MKILQQRDKILSNYEVYEHLMETQKENEWAFTIPQQSNNQQKKKRRFNPQLLDLEIITRDLSQYLVKQNQSNDTKRESFINLMIFLNSFDLEVIEKLMIVNSLPRSLVNLYAIIEECESRFSQEQCESILENVQEYFPLAEEEPVEEQDLVEAEPEDAEMPDEEEEEDEDAFVQDDELEHEGLVTKKNTEKEIDEVDA